jgi:hypothetical protein
MPTTLPTNRPAHALSLIYTLQSEAPFQPEMGVECWRVNSTIPASAAPWFLSWRDDHLSLGSEAEGWVCRVECPAPLPESLALVRHLLKRARNLQEAVRWACEHTP